jgi:hypothetical protein
VERSSQSRADAPFALASLAPVFFAFAGLLITLISLLSKVPTSTLSSPLPVEGATILTDALTLRLLPAEAGCLASFAPFASTPSLMKRCLAKELP